MLSKNRILKSEYKKLKSHGESFSVVDPDKHALVYQRAKKTAMTALIKPYDAFVYLDHQAEGVAWMMGREDDDAPLCRGGVLADDMGLGKTWQTMGLLLNMPVALTLLVCPPVLSKQWTDALTASGLEWAVLGPKGFVGSATPAVFLSTYDRLISCRRYVSQVAWDRVVLDEGQAIRNGPKTARYRAVAGLLAERRWILSGTPVQNKKADFKHLATWLGVAAVTAHNCSDVATQIMLRRSVSLLADRMPAAPVHERLDVEFDSVEEQEMFRTLVGALEHAIERNFPSSNRLELYLRIQMFISHPQIYIEAMQRKYGAEYRRDAWTGTASKLAAFKRKLDGPTEPTLVFCHFKTEMDFVAEAAMARGYNVFFVRGGMADAARKQEIANSAAYAAEGKPVLMVCQIAAGNAGLNLQHLQRVIFYTQHWNPSVLDQALCRSYRYGQTGTVSASHLLLGSADMLNIDRIMLGKHQVKRKAAMEVMPALKFAHHPEFEVVFDMMPV